MKSGLIGLKSILLKIVIENHKPAGYPGTLRQALAVARVLPGYC